MPRGNYLRMRGEYIGIPYAPCYRGELPPHARRIQRLTMGVADSAGTTSACAENTEYLKPRHEASWNYLRMRGEYVA